VSIRATGNGQMVQLGITRTGILVNHQGHCIALLGVLMMAHGLTSTAGTLMYIISVKYKTFALWTKPQN